MAGQLWTGQRESQLGFFVLHPLPLLAYAKRFRILGAQNQKMLRPVHDFLTQIQKAF